MQIAKQNPLLEDLTGSICPLGTFSMGKKNAHAGLIQHQASSPTHGLNTGMAENLVRLSVGLEHPDDLSADIVQAIEAA